MGGGPPKGDLFSSSLRFLFVCSFVCVHILSTTEHEWRGALLDGGHANASIGLHRHWIDAENILVLMARYLEPLPRRDGDAAACETRAQQRVLLTGAYTSIRD